VPGVDPLGADRRPPARRLHFVDTVTLDVGLSMMLFDRFEVRGVQHAIDLVVLLAEQDVVVRDPELVRRRILQLAQDVRRERLHGMGIDELWHGCHLLYYDWPKPTIH